MAPHDFRHKESDSSPSSVSSSDHTYEPTGTESSDSDSNLSISFDDGELPEMYFRWSIKGTMRMDGTKFYMMGEATFGDPASAHTAVQHTVQLLTTSLIVSSATYNVYGYLG